MSEPQESIVRKPQFVYEQRMNPDDERALKILEAAIFAKPDVIQRALAVIAGREEDTPEVEVEAEKVPYEDEVKLATSRRGGPEFDPATEDAIAASGAMRAVQQRRKINQGNPIAEQRDAAEVRHTRLEIFVGMVAQYNEATRRQQEAAQTSGDVVHMPEPREPARRTRTRSRSA